MAVLPLAAAWERAFICELALEADDVPEDPGVEDRPEAEVAPFRADVVLAAALEVAEEQAPSTIAAIAAPVANVNRDEPLIRAVRHDLDPRVRLYIGSPFDPTTFDPPLGALPIRHAGRAYAPTVGRTRVEPHTPLVVMTVAGSDSGAGAGAQADLKAMTGLGAYAVTAITAVTAQNTVEVREVLPVSAEFVDLQIETILDDFEVSAVKTGMLGTIETVKAVGRHAAAKRLPNLVVDPVLASSTGHPLIESDAVRAYRELLLPYAQVVTPNLREAALLTNRDAISTLAEMELAAWELSSLGSGTVVVKGGHLSGRNAPDLVVHHGKVFVLDERRITTANDHGTGCTLSAAIATFLARGLEPLDALRRAKAYVSAALDSARTWQLGKGRGPLHHLVHLNAPELAE